MFQPGDRVRFKGEEHFPMVVKSIGNHSISWKEQCEFIEECGLCGTFVEEDSGRYASVDFDKVGLREGFFIDRFELDLPVFEIDECELEGLI